MPRKPSVWSRATIYRLTCPGTLTACLRDKYLDRPGFTAHPVTVAGKPGLLVVGQIRADKVDWSADLTRYIGRDVEAHNDTAAAALLLSVDRQTYALCYGMGFHLLDYTLVEATFGLQFLARVANVNDLRSATQHYMDHRARIDRRSIPSGANVQAFGLAELGTVVSKVVARTAIKAGGKSVTIRGADALNLPVPRDPGELVRELAEIETTLAMPVAHPDLELLVRIMPLQRQHAQLKPLNARLCAALSGASTEPLGTGWPWERSDEFGAVEKLRLLHIPGSEDVDVDWLSVEHLATIVQKSSRDPLALLRKVKVILLSDDSTPVSSEIPALKWIAFQTRLDDRLYFFQDGRWFTVAQDYESHVREQAAQILASRSTLVLPPWPTMRHEKEYNKLVSELDDTYLTLDCNPIRTAAHPRGIEHCDLLGPNDEFIFVKRLRGSDDASHLFAQVDVAIEQLLYDAEGQRVLASKIAASSGATRVAPRWPAKVVLAVGGRGALHVDDLFTFSQVTLVRLGQHLNTRGILLEVAAIP